MINLSVNCCNPLKHQLSELCFNRTCRRHVHKEIPLFTIHCLTDSVTSPSDESEFEDRQRTSCEENIDEVSSGSVN